MHFAVGTFCYFIKVFENISGKGGFVSGIGHGETNGEIWLALGGGQQTRGQGAKGRERGWAKNFRVFFLGAGSIGINKRQGSMTAGCKNRS